MTVSAAATVYNIYARMKNKGRRADYVLAGASTKNLETTRDERLQIIALREKAGMTWRVSYTISTSYFAFRS